MEGKYHKMLRKAGSSFQHSKTPHLVQGFILTVQWVYKYKIVLIKGQSP